MSGIKYFKLDYSSLTYMLIFIINIIEPAWIIIDSAKTIKNNV